MIWSDDRFKRYGREIIEPYEEKNIQPNSYELTLDDEIKIATDNGWIEKKLPYELPKGIFTLASTKESVKIPQGVVGKVVGKSSIARLGLAIEFAGLIDTGFKGQITLEIFNFAHPIKLMPNQIIAQLVLEDSYTCDKMYGEYENHYQNQKGATKSWMDKFSN